MPVFTPNKEDRPEGVAFEAIPAGSYHLQVVKAEPAYASSGNAMIEWAFEVINHEDLAGRRVFERSVLTDGAMAYPGTGFWALLEALGIYDEMEDVEFDDVEALATYLQENLVDTGATIYGTVKQRKYKDKMQNEVTGWEADSDDPDPDDLPNETEPEPEPAKPAAKKTAAKKTAAKRAGGPPY